jgi:hypothetical protein
VDGVSLSDAQYRIVVGAGGAVLVGVITFVRFCGSLSLPEKPPQPTGPTGTARQLLSQSSSSTPVYLDALERDAASAGIRKPSLDDMSRKLAYRVDEARHVLELGAKPLDAAGLRLRIDRSSELLVLQIDNLTDVDLAYQVITAPSGGAACNSARPLPFNAMVIASKSSEARTECDARIATSIVVSKIETLEVPKLSTWYLSQIPPALVGIEPRIARGHQGIDVKEKCSTVVAQTIRSGMERGEIRWRDLVDFYARHRCQTYQFPSTYRAFSADGERALPAVGTQP